MVIFGYAKSCYYTGDGTMMIKVRIPSIHGPYNQRDYKSSKSKKSYVKDQDLPEYPSLLLPHRPNEGEVVALASMSNTSNNFVVIGLTGGQYQSNITDTSLSGLKY